MEMTNLHWHVEEMARKKPDYPALLYFDKKLTYSQLNQRSNQLANYLLSKQITPEEPIGICIERGFDLFIAILAVLKAGCAYVPLEPREPTRQLERILAHSNANILLTQIHLATRFSEFPIQKIVVDDEEKPFETQSSNNLDLAIDAHHLAYIIYSKTSARQLNGVCIEHSNVLNLLEDAPILFQLTPQSQVLQFFSMKFDVFTLEWALALTRGATLCLLPSYGKKLTLIELYETLPFYNIDIAFFPLEFVERLSAHCLPSLKTLVLYRNASASSILSKFPDHVRLLNIYGSNEVTVFSLACIGDMAPSPKTLGHPVINTQAYLLNEDLLPIPKGTIGDIYIGGACLARGYLNQPELTQERFIPHPYALDERIYKTGHRGQRLRDESIEYVEPEDKKK